MLGEKFEHRSQVLIKYQLLALLMQHLECVNVACVTLLLDQPNRHLLPLFRLNGFHCAKTHRIVTL